MKWNIGTKIGGGFALALLALLVIGGVSYRSTNALTDTADLVTHTHVVLENLDLLLSGMKDAETGQRGYLITGEDSYLEPYTSSQTQTSQVLKTVRDLTKDNTDQQRKIDTIESLIGEKYAELKETIDLRKNPDNGFEAAKKVVLTDKGKETMDAIRKNVLGMEEEAKDMLNKRSEEAAKTADQARSTIIWGTFIAFAILFLAGFTITRNISAPLNILSGAAEKISTGDLKVSVSTDNREDEVGRLSKAFSRMTTSLQNMAGLAKQIAASDLRIAVKPQSELDVLGNAFAAMVENLRRTTTELSEGVNVLSSSASEILASTTQVASGAAETGTAITETTATVEEVKQTAQVASQKARYVSDNAQKATQIAQSGKKSVETSIQGMKRIQSQMESIAESVVKLSEQGQAIGEIIASVNDLAEQSNLLAVNAAIEAAKAGEHGRGFSVVAQEVKSLAEQSKQATAQVRTILNDIQKATTAAVLATEQGSKAVEAGVKQSLEAGESISQLSDSITEASQAAMQIAASSQQQVVGTEQVALAMENIKQASAQNVAGTKQAESAAHNLHELGQKLKVLVEQYKV